MKFRAHRLLVNYFLPLSILMLIIGVIAIPSCDLYTNIALQGDLETCKKELSSLQPKPNDDSPFIEADDYIE